MKLKQQKIRSYKIEYPSTSGDFVNKVSTFLHRQIDMKHEFLQQVRENWRKVFCVIVGVAKTTTDSTIHMKTDVKGEEKIEPEGVSRTVVKGERKVELIKYFRTSSSKLN